MKNPETVNEIYNQISIRNREKQNNLKKYNNFINYLTNIKSGLGYKSHTSMHKEKNYNNSISPIIKKGSNYER